MIQMLFGDLAPWFTGPALLGTGFLLIQLVLGELNGEGALALDVDLGLEADLDLDRPGHEFGILSLQSLSAFFMGFGWIGLAAYRFLDLGFTGGALMGLAAGAGVAWLMITVMRMTLRLQSDANVSIRQAVGLVGEVQVMVPPPGEGRGEVALVINNTSHHYAAVQDGREASAPIGAHARVRVVRADTEGNVIIVEPAN